jgi:hydrogenase-4 component H
MRLPKLREIKEALRAIIKGPYTSKFPFAPHQPLERFRGRPKYDRDKCIGCGACAQVCPPQTIELNDLVGENPPIRRLSLRYDSCIFCGQCEASCPTKEGIKLSREFDLADFNRQEIKDGVEKELLLCECCGETIGPKDQLLWLYQQLGPLAFTNPTILSCALSDTKATGAKPKAETFSRPDYLRLLCPKCRREIAFKEALG